MLWVVCGVIGCAQPDAEHPIVEMGMQLVSTAPPIALDDGASPILAEPVGAIELEDGRILIADGSDRDIKIYSPSGTRIGVLGRKGPGPNEFMSLTGIALINKTIVALDNQQFRFNRFDANDLAPLSAVRLEGFKGMPMTVSSASDSELLVSRFALGEHRGDLIAIVDADGTVRGGVLNERDYFEDDPWLIQRVTPKATVSSDLVFAASGGGDPVVSIYTGTTRARLAKVRYQVVDESGSHDVPSARTLRGKMTSDEVRNLPEDNPIDRRRFLSTLTGLPDSAVVMVFRRFDAPRGVDWMAPANAAVIRWCRDGWRLSNAAPIPGMVVGTGHQGELLVLSYADDSRDRYRLHRLSPQFAGGAPCDAAPS
ncbi:MAG: 6-bladed beta-propeller [Gemmatimonadales bacterium]|nr:6-bladed beta-propeller [Gemmatimonadales bacterium]MDZ4388148.1 6-bladed beta-propeller [Gemmatimonadales bacterium]